jgi:UDP-N-acetylmuramate dehydrogenase
VNSAHRGAAQEPDLGPIFGGRLRRDVPLAPYTSARIGGAAEYLLEVKSAADLAEAAHTLWSMELKFRVLGGGTNVLVSDEGARGVVILNKATGVRFQGAGAEPNVWAESGAALGTVGRRAVERGLGGLEWATTIPGTVGGAVVGNAGAHGEDVANCLSVAEILQPGKGPQPWTPDRLTFSYRGSWLKDHPGRAVVLSAVFRLHASTAEETRRRAREFGAYRRATQPSGASWGSMFKNPPGDYAGRLIEAAGLKGTRRGDIEISRKHANFFVNLGEGTARDAWELIQSARERVEAQFGVRLELEIEPFGDWQANPIWVSNA